MKQPRSSNSLWATSSDNLIAACAFFARMVELNTRTLTSFVSARELCDNELKQTTLRLMGKQNACMPRPNPQMNFRGQRSGTVTDYPGEDRLGVTASVPLAVTWQISAAQGFSRRFWLRRTRHGCNRHLCVSTRLIGSGRRLTPSQSEATSRKSSHSYVSPSRLIPQFSARMASTWTSLRPTVHSYTRGTAS